jgi:hypothetical protein
MRIGHSPTQTRHKCPFGCWVHRNRNDYAYNGRGRWLLAKFNGFMIERLTGVIPVRLLSSQVLRFPEAPLESGIRGG